MIFMSFPTVFQSYQDNGGGVGGVGGGVGGR